MAYPRITYRRTATGYDIWRERGPRNAELIGRITREGRGLYRADYAMRVGYVRDAAFATVREIKAVVARAWA